MSTKPPTPSSKDSPTASPSSFYLPFPPELRNKILSLALTGGHVYFRSSLNSQKLSHKPTSVDSTPKSSPAVNLLATCRQAYDEGHAMYYSDNVFHFPPGRNRVLKAALAKIKPEHLAMMKHVVIRLSLQDRTFSMISWDLRWSDGSINPRLSSRLIDIWYGKLFYVQSTFENLNKIHINLSRIFKYGAEASAIELTGPNYRETIKNWRCWLNISAVAMLEIEGNSVSTPEWSAAQWGEIDVEMIAIEKFWD